MHGRACRPEIRRVALRLTVGLWGGLALASYAAAQTPHEPAPSAGSALAANCVLHIWPADGAHTTFQGWIRAGAVDGARRGVKGYPDFHASALDTPEQAHLLESIDWRAALHDPTLAVKVHDTPTGASDDRTRKARLIADSPPCYREVVVTSAIVESEVFSALSVRILAVRKRFDAADSTPASFSSMSVAPVGFSDADKAAPDAEARFDAAVRAAYVQAAKQFGIMQLFH